MTALALRFLEYAFAGFWSFLGALCVLALVTRYAFLAWNRLLRMLSIRKHGWPPAHCDADGDAIPAADIARKAAEKEREELALLVDGWYGIAPDVRGALVSVIRARGKRARERHDA